MNPKELALAHFEKVILLLCLGIFGWFLMGVLSIKPYERKPTEFSTATQAARQYVTDPNRKLPETESKELADSNYNTQVAKLFRDFQAGDFQSFFHNLRWVRPFDYGINFRNEPKILAPGKPILQTNRGLMQTYQIDEDGNPIMRKVTKSRFKKGGKLLSGKGFLKQFGGKGGRGGRGDQSGVGGIGGMEGADEMNGGSSSGDDSFDQMMGMQMMGGMGGGRGGRGNMEMGSSDDSDDMSGMLSGGVTKGPDSKPRHRILERGKKENEKPDDSKKQPEEEEPIESREGYRWVEICAPFPHSQQVVEFVNALKEGYQNVKLNYATIDIQRRELLPDLTWSEFRPLNIKEQFDIVQSAIGFERETSPALVQGLAMNVPLLDVYQRVFLHEQLDLYTKVEPAEYTEEQRDPIGFELDKERRRAAEALLNPLAKSGKAKTDDTKEKEKKHLAERPKGQKFGFNDPSKSRDGVRPNRYELKTALIRFWDFTVEPGKKYRYRIRVRAYNPNFKRDDVAESEFARRVTLVGEWSPESEPVFVDFDNHWYLSDQQTSRIKSDEVMLEVHHWYRGMGQWLVGNFPQRIGQFIGLGTSVKEISALKWNDQRYDYDVRKFRNDPEFDSGSILLGFNSGSEEFDIGGRNRTIAMPNFAVSVNPLGELVMHEESLDTQDTTRLNIVENYNEVVRSIGGDTDSKKKDDDKPGDPTKRGKGKGGRGGK